MDKVVAALAFVVCFAVFRWAPVQQASDSRYSMLLAETILREGTFTLDRYELPERDYRIEDSNGHRYYFFPPGSSLLSVPFVALMHVRGLSAVRTNGAYSPGGELAEDALLAATVMAGFGALAYLTARLVLPVSASLVTTFVSVFGTQVLSTTSRSMWSDTWGITLIGLAVFLLLRSAVRREPANWPFVAMLEAWAYVVRPTNSIALVGTTLYLAVTYRKDLWSFLVTVAGWLGLFVAYSWFHFHRVFPAYFAGARLRLPLSPSAFFGNLVSPSRGWLIYVPAVIAIGLALVRYRRTLRFRGLVGLAVFAMAAHFAVLSSFVHWWGGHCYGARLTTSLVPWLLLLGLLAVDAWRVSRARGGHGPLDAVFGVTAGGLCLASVGCNAVGAFSQEAGQWNVRPDNIDADPDRLWSWARPQFLSPFVEAPGDYLPLPSEGLAVGGADADRYLGSGWAYGEGEFRWTEGSGGSTVRFSLPKGQSGTLELELRPYLVTGRLVAQRLVASMNDRVIGAFRIDAPQFATYEVDVQGESSRAENVFSLRLPDAASPEALEGLTDKRRLGVAVRVIRWHRRM